MSIRIVGYPEAFTKTTFPGGESCIRVTMNTPMEPDLTLELAFENNGDLFDLALLADALRRKFPEKKLKLWMGYTPYARQDRVCNEGESLSIKVVADFINSLKFEAVCIIDPHSDVTPALFERAMVIEQKWLCTRPQLRTNPSNTIIVAPDAGAAKKARAFAQLGGFAGLVQAEKVRELSTGNILETRVQSEHIGDKDFLIVDDICDGGRTFTELAKVLRPLTNGKIKLFVTHGIFSAGEKVFDNLIDEVYTANPVGATGRAAVESGIKVVRI
jgi:ribose-phosphate pyrophosphokinase